jgi:hypothetical protein
MTLRAKCVAALRASLKGCHLSLNLRGHDLLLQAREQRFAFCYSQSTVAGEISSARLMIPSSCPTGLPGTASNTSLIVHFIPKD